MTAGFDNPACIHNLNHVSTSGNGEAVGDDDRGAAFCVRTKPLKPVGFGPRIQCACRLIQENDRGLPEKGPGQGKLLPFAPR